MALPIWSRFNKGEFEVVTLSLKHADRLNRRRTELPGILVARRLWPHLRKYRVINEDIEEDFEGCRTNKEKVARLIDHLEKGPTWRLHAFCRACNLTCQEHVISHIGLDPADYEGSDCEETDDARGVKRAKMTLPQPHEEYHPDYDLPDAGPSDSGTGLVSEPPEAQRFVVYFMLLHRLLGHSSEFQEKELSDLHISAKDYSFLHKMSSKDLSDSKMYVLDHPVCKIRDKNLSAELIKLISLSLFASKEWELQKQVFTLLSKHKATDVMKAICMTLLLKNEGSGLNSEDCAMTEPKFLLDEKTARSSSKYVYKQVQEISSKINWTFDQLVTEQSAASPEKSMAQSTGVERASTLLADCSTQQQIQVGESTLGKIFPRTRCSIQEALSAGNNGSVMVTIKVLQVTGLQAWSGNRKIFLSEVADSTSFCTVKCYGEKFYSKFTVGSSLLLCNALSKSDGRLVLTACSSVLSTSEVVVPDNVTKQCEGVMINKCSHHSIAEILDKGTKRPAFVIAKVLQLSGVTMKNVGTPTRRIKMRHLLLKDATGTAKVVLWSPEAEKNYKTGDVVKISHVRKGDFKGSPQLSTTKYDSVVEFLPNDNLSSVTIDEDDLQTTDPELHESGTPGMMTAISKDIYVYDACPSRTCKFKKLRPDLICPTCGTRYTKPSSWGFTYISLQIGDQQEKKKAWMGALTDIGVYLGLPFPYGGSKSKRNNWVAEVTKHLPMTANFVIEKTESCSAVIY